MAEPSESVLEDGLQQSVAPHLSVQLRHIIGALEIDVDFELTKPWTILFGPSGSGKTTILRAIAGLLRPKQARIVSSARILLQDGGSMTLDFVMTDTANGIFRPAHERAIPIVSQNAALFPHLSVLENIRYGFFDLARTPQERKQNDDDLKALLARCRVEHLTAKMPAQLSGGECRRVALARSLSVAGRSTLLLLDEPFSGLDAPLRDELVTSLRDWQAVTRTPILSVTHDVAEAFQLNAEVIKIAEGKVVQQGPVAEVLAEERTCLLQQLHA